jgi:hypothetical protein
MVLFIINYLPHLFNIMAMVNVAVCPLDIEVLYVKK